MKKYAVLLALLVLLPACCFAAPLPDLAPFLNAEGRQQLADYAYSDEYLCNVWVFPRNSYTEAGCGYWMLDCLESGFALHKTSVEGYDAYVAADSAGRSAMLLPDYGGVVMLMVETTLPYAPALPTEAPAPTAAPPADAGASGGHWETVSVEVDCPSCTNGVCKLCHGSGTYRLYGEAVACDKECSACDGAGSYTSTRTVWVND